MIFRSSESAERFRARKFIDMVPRACQIAGKTSAPLNWKSDTLSTLPFVYLNV